MVAKGVGGDEEGIDWEFGVSRLKLTIHKMDKQHGSSV